MPSWVKSEYEYIPAEQDSEKYQNTRNNLRTALRDPRLGNEFILMNDDFFIMKPIEKIPALRRLKNIEHYIDLFSRLKSDGYYVQAMVATRDILQEWGIHAISSYELHVPMLFDKNKLLALMRKLPENSPSRHIRTLYGNYYGIDGERIRDVKVINDDQEIDYEGIFLSTSDESFEQGKVGEYIRDVLS